MNNTSQIARLIESLPTDLANVRVATREAFVKYERAYNRAHTDEGVTIRYCEQIGNPIRFIENPFDAIDLLRECEGNAIVNDVVDVNDDKGDLIETVGGCSILMAHNDREAMLFVSPRVIKALFHTKTIRLESNGPATYGALEYYVLTGTGMSAF